MEHSDVMMMSLDGVRRTVLMAVSPPEGVGVEKREWRILESLMEEEEGGGLEGMLRGLSMILVYEVSVECLDRIFVRFSTTKNRPRNP